ncbi:12338_t:CDS:2 [Gigaspora rosea]|nr:12338_t:CDS:2 [Gigaspora rosea]
MYLGRIVPDLVNNISDNPISHYYEHGDRDNNSLKSYMWYSAGDDDGSDNDYVP